MKWDINDKKDFGKEKFINLISGLLWIMFIKRLIEKIDAIKDARIKSLIIINGSQKIILVSMNNSLIKLMEGGAEILIATKINHQNEILGNVFINPFNDIMLRVWNFR